MDWLVQMFGEAQQRLFEGVVQPFLFHFGMANLLEDGYTATGWLLVGLLRRGAYQPSSGWGKYFAQVLLACSLLAAL